MEKLLRKTPKNFLMCITSLFQEMAGMHHDEVIVHYSNKPPNKGFIRTLSGGLEQANCMRIIALLPTKEIKIEYRKNTGRFLIFKATTEIEMQEFVNWIKDNVDKLSPEQFKNHYSTIDVDVYDHRP